MSPPLLPTFCDTDELGRFSSHIPDVYLVQVEEKIELGTDLPSQNSTYSP